MEEWWNELDDEPAATQDTPMREKISLDHLLDPDLADQRKKEELFQHSVHVTVGYQLEPLPVAVYFHYAPITAAVNPILEGRRSETLVLKGLVNLENCHSWSRFLTLIHQLWLEMDPVHHHAHWEYDRCRQLIRRKPVPMYEPCYLQRGVDGICNILSGH